MVFPYKLKRSFDKAADNYNDYAAIQSYMAKEIDERLSLLSIQPNRVLDLGAGTGMLSQHLHHRYPEACLTAIDISEKMLNQPAHSKWNTMINDAHQLSLVDNSIDLIASNAMMQWSYDIGKLIQEVSRSLTYDGVFIFASFGPQTLQELKRAWLTVDPSYQHINPFLDMHDLGDELVRAQFSNPVMETQNMTLTYDTWQAALADIRGVGSRNHLLNKRKTLTGSQRLKALGESLIQQSPMSEKIVMTYEIVYGHCFKTPPRPPKQAEPFYIDPNQISTLK